MAINRTRQPVDFSRVTFARKRGREGKGGEERSDVGFHGAIRLGYWFTLVRLFPSPCWLGRHRSANLGYVYYPLPTLDPPCVGRESRACDGIARKCSRGRPAFLREDDARNLAWRTSVERRRPTSSYVVLRRRSPPPPPPSLGLRDANRDANLGGRSPDRARRDGHTDDARIKQRVEKETPTERTLISDLSTMERSL